MTSPSHAVQIRYADPSDREAIYRIRHDVYAQELGQHETRPEGRLHDWVDEVNLYLVAELDGALAGFVSVTPPNPRGYSVDKYFPRATLPFAFDGGLHEVRLLTVVAPRRGLRLAQILMMAALRAVQAQGGTSIVAIGRVELLPMYEAAGLRAMGHKVRSGAVDFELLHGATQALRDRAAAFCALNPDLLAGVAWPAEPASTARPGAPHGGRSFAAIGERFDDVSRRHAVIAADVLDAWFPPAPGVLRAVQADLDWLLRTSPPVAAQGLVEAIAEARGVPAGSILAGAGSSDLIHRALRQWVRPSDRVLILDPTYSEYGHVLASLGCRIDRLPLEASNDYRLAPDALRAALGNRYDWVFLVNPNNPTGQHVPRRELERLIAEAPSGTNFWVDETYVEYAGPGESLERYAAASRNVVVCKSMSKVYALSGVRIGYLCGPVALVDGLRTSMPPWSVSTVAQAAACAALREQAYYELQWNATHGLSERLGRGLQDLGWNVVPSCGNFLLCRLPADGPDANRLIETAAARGLYLRATTGMGETLDGRTLRIAVHDEATNQRMLGILRDLLRPVTV